MLRKDYKAPLISVSNTRLDFLIINDETVHVQANYIVSPKDNWDGILTLNCGEAPDVKEIKIDDQFIDLDLVETVKTSYGTDFIIKNLNTNLACLNVVVKTKLNPSKNTSLEGLYLSDGILVTQCESHGFRNITPSFDTPDILSKYKVRINTPSAMYPVSLSNGNLIDDTDFQEIESVFSHVNLLDLNFTSKTYEDPFAKPSYLFAIVAGKLGFIQDEFITMNNNKVELSIFAEESKLSQCYFAMEALKRSMYHDEKFYNLEYDLDNYKIVAINDFNAGAMENKGLNVFNSKCILADPEYTTDDSFNFVDRVIAHEYFHNYTGNRVTLQDWFELTLKEGLTVFRDQEYAEEVDSYVAARLGQISDIKNHQFKEDAGPTSHPIRPDEVKNMSNFYTSTVYDKGAEIIRMISTIIGREQMHLAVKNYLDVFDGKAVSCEDFIASIEKFSHFDFSQFRLWYSQNGTPSLSVSREFNKETGELKLSFEQEYTSKNESFLPFHIPFKVKFFNPDDGSVIESNLEDDIIHIKGAKTTLVIHCDGCKNTPLISGLRDFSAPVNYSSDMTDVETQLLMKYDDSIVSSVQLFEDFKDVEVLRSINDDDYKLSSDITDIINKNLEGFIDGTTDLSAMSWLLTTPSLDYLTTQVDTIDLERIYKSIDDFGLFLSHGCKENIIKALDHLLVLEINGKILDEHTAFDYDVAKLRTLRFQLLKLVARIDTKSADKYFPHDFSNSNFTDKLNTLSTLVNFGFEADATCSIVKGMFDFASYDSNAFVSVLSTVCSGREFEFKDLIDDYEDLVDRKNPNAVRAFVGTLTRRRDFHNLDGSGYQYLVDWIIELDKSNPSLASRLILSLDFNNHKTERYNLMKSYLVELSEQVNSSELKEKIGLMLD